MVTGVSDLSLHLDALLQERFEQVVCGLCQPECLDDVELSKPDGKSFLGKSHVNNTRLSMFMNSLMNTNLDKVDDGPLVLQLYSHEVLHSESRRVNDHAAAGHLLRRTRFGMLSVCVWGPCFISVIGTGIIKF